MLVSFLCHPGSFWASLTSASVLPHCSADTPIEEFTPTPAFPALQYLESVDEGGVAWQAGLRTGDFLIEVRAALCSWWILLNCWKTLAWFSGSGCRIVPLFVLLISAAKLNLLLHKLFSIMVSAVSLLTSSLDSSTNICILWELCLNPNVCFSKQRVLCALTSGDVLTHFYRSMTLLTL